MPSSRRFKLCSCAVLLFFEIALVSWLWYGEPPELIKVHFYSISWWPYLMLVDTIADLLWGKSLLWNKPAGFLRIALFSIPFWTMYEILNVVLRNWAYIGLPGGDISIVRWSGYALAYASVLPAIRVYSDLLNNAPETKPHTAGPSGRRGITVAAVSLSAVFVALFLAFPGKCFPLVWGFSFLITEPVMMRIASARSYLLEWLQGKWIFTLKTVCAGMLAGFTWEFLNWKAAAKWIYTLPPEVDFCRIFEMPILGYVGFGVFALCAESFSNIVLSDFEKKYPLAWRAMIGCGVIIVIIGFACIDRHTWIR
ncbi:hypothetical protein ACFL6Y_07620 [Elusimicrobiota bacterium]